MKNHKFTHAQLARIGKCSRSAVTLAYSGKGTLSQETRERILKIGKLKENIEEQFKNPLFSKILDIAFEKLPKKTKKYEEVRVWIINIRALHIYLRDGHTKNLSDLDIICRETDPVTVALNKDFSTVCVTAHKHTSDKKLALFATDLLRSINLITTEKE